MRKMIFILVALFAVLLVGCSTQNNVSKDTSTVDNSAAESTALDPESTNGINEVSKTSETLDTSQVDTELDNTKESLSNW